MLTTKSLVSIHPHTVDPLYPFHPPVMPSLLVTTSLFSVSMGLSLFHLVCSFVLVLFYIPHMSEIVQCLSFFIWLISLSIILSRTIFQKDIYTLVFGNRSRTLAIWSNCLFKASGVMLPLRSTRKSMDIWSEMIFFCRMSITESTFGTQFGSFEPFSRTVKLLLSNLS